MRKRKTYGTEKYTMDGIAIELVRKNVRNINMRVRKDGTVTVSAHPAVPEKDVLSFVASKRDWIVKVISRQNEQKVLPDRKYETGETIRVFGRRYLLRVSGGGRYNMALSYGTGSDPGKGLAMMSAPYDSTPERRAAFVERWYKDLLSRELSERVPYWESVTGLKCSGWRIRRMKSRWGSCNTRTHQLCFNSRLAHLDRKYLDYVIVHELAHTKVPNHSAAFWAIVGRYMPDYKKTRRDLNSEMPDFNEI
jgi:predicted metal-dependent hydrolase